MNQNADVLLNVCIRNPESNNELMEAYTSVYNIFSTYVDTDVYQLLKIAHCRLTYKANLALKNNILGRFPIEIKDEIAKYLITPIDLPLIEFIFLWPCKYKKCNANNIYDFLWENNVPFDHSLQET